jgi:hypothetical protein
VSTGVNRFYNSIKDADSAKVGDLIDLFAYYLTEEAGEQAATAKSVDECFRLCSLNVPARTAPHLSESARPEAKKFIKVVGGYKLQRHYCDLLKIRLGIERVAMETSSELRALEAKLAEGPKKQFLSETVDCFEVKAYRAAIIMCWILVLDHLYEFIMKNQQKAFNDELSKVKDKRVKVTEIQVRDDFNDIPEGKFIELLRAAGIVSNDVRKILDEKLGTRNSCAHPSGIQIKRSKAIDFIEDLVENVILKYAI